MKQPMIDYSKIEQAYQKIFAPLYKGAIYRAVTIDNDVVDGKLTYSSIEKVELQVGNCFRSFNRSTTKLTLIESTDNS